MSYRARVMSGETLNVTLANGNKGEIYFDALQDSIVFRVREGGEYCAVGSVEAVCAPESDYLEEKYLIGAEIALTAVGLDAAA